MINGKTVLAIIPARGGSKGVPRKNIRDLAGKPLIAWSIEAANKSQYIDRLVISTEDHEIAEVATQWGGEVPFLRPVHLAQDTTSGIDPILHAIEEIPGFDYVVLLQPTSPLRTSQDIDECIQLCDRAESETCVAIVESEKNPLWMFKLNCDSRISPVIESDLLPKRRQDLSKVYSLNGAIYVSKVDYLIKHKTLIDKNTIGYVMPKDRSIDIDTELDILICNAILKLKKC